MALIKKISFHFMIRREIQFNIDPIIVKPLMKYRLKLKNLLRERI